MSLIDKFREIAADVPPSHVPSLNELAQVVGASILYAEHGDGFLKAAESGAEGIAKLLAPEAADIADAAAPEAAPLINESERLIEGLPPVERDQAVEPAAPVEYTALDPSPSPADAVAPVTDTPEAAPEPQAEPTSDAQTIAELRAQLQAAQVDLANARATQVSSGEGQS